MSKFLTFREKEQLMRKLAQELEKLEEDPALKSEVEFKKAIEALLTKYDKKPEDLAKFFTLPTEKPKAKGKYSPRATLVFINPHTNERVETKGANQKTLIAWRNQYGKEEVASWQQK